MQMLDKRTGSFRRRIATGFRIIYRAGEQNFCPACGGRNWIIGRMTAECSFCATALPLEHAHSYGYTPRFTPVDRPYTLSDGSELRLRA